MVPCGASVAPGASSGRGSPRTGPWRWSPRAASGPWTARRATGPDGAGVISRSPGLPFAQVVFLLFLLFGLKKGI